MMDILTRQKQIIEFIYKAALEVEEKQGQELMQGALLLKLK